jgi:pimeloyl-ACP methyl ester carboxylesterase
MSTWILLRGLTREAAHWGAFPATLAHALPEAKVITLDLPGNGTCHDQRSPRSVVQMAQACRAELRHRDVVPPYHLLAMSLGAMVATEWARDAPHEVAGCVLINTSFRPFSAFHRRLRPANYLRLLRLALVTHDALAMETMVWRLTSNQTRPDAATLAQWVSTRAVHPVTKANALRQLVAAARYRAPARAPVPDILLLASTRDGLVHSGCSQAIALAWARRLVMHPTAGHDLPLDDPAWVVQQVREAVLAWDGADQAHPNLKHNT